MANRCSSALGIEQHLPSSGHLASPARAYPHRPRLPIQLNDPRPLKHLTSNKSGATICIFAQESERNVLVGVAGITSKTQSIQRSVVGDGADVIGPDPDVDNDFGCGSWAFPPWQQHQESGRWGGSEDGGSRGLLDSASSTLV